MKKNSPSLMLHLSPGVGHRARNSQALILVLGVMVLISALMVGFLLSATSGRVSASNYSTTARTRQLADLAVNMVQAQINQAISYSHANGYAWASQPGALRVFNNNALDSAYRLYSAPVMISTGGGTAVSTNMDVASTSPGSRDMPPTAWASLPAVWVDLNAPAPVIGLTNTTTGDQAIAYPILDTRNFSGSGTITPEGFGITNAPGATALQPAPMPVQWLYVLQNGEIIPVDPGGNGVTVTFTHASVQPSSSDPIVGRIAFWTDDETCKINVNTAGGDGINNTANNSTNTANLTFWDTPHFISAEDTSNALYQPAAHEYQRYPGHPATTALRDVLNSLGYTSLISSSFYGPQAGNSGYGVTPRYAFGGSEGGTTEGTNITAGISTRGDRLYPTVGEMLFNPDHTASSLNSGVVQQMEPGKFFLTANSKAPEVNLFGQPRISMWPVSASNDADHRTATDQLLAFASTVGGLPYYFTRTDPSNTTNDITIPRNAALLSYLDRLTQTAIPGFGYNFNSKYPVSSASGTAISERQQILTEIFDYIRTTNIHDSTVNDPYAAIAGNGSAAGGGVGQVVPSVDTAWNTQGFGRMYRVNEMSLLFYAMGHGLLTNSTGTTQPVNVSGYNPGPWTDNYGTNFTITGNPGAGSSATGTLAPGMTAIRAFLIFSIYDPSMGFSYIDPKIYYNVDGLQNLTVKDGAGTNQVLGFQGAANITPIGILDSGSPWFQSYGGGTLLGGVMDPRCVTGGRWLSYTTNNQPIIGQDGHRFPFYSSIVAVTNYGPTGSLSPLQINGTTLTVSILPPPGNPLTNTSGSMSYPVGTTTPAIQTYTVSFPQVTIPIPQVNTGSYTSSSGTLAFPFPPIVGATNNYGGNTNNPVFDRWAANWGMTNGQANPFIAGGDVVRSIVPASGDIRMLALNSVPASGYTTIANYANTNLFPAHNYSCPNGVAFYGAETNNDVLVGGAVYGISGWPNTALPSSIGAQTHSGGNSWPGDWNNGVADAPDGPYIDRPDEGSAAQTNGVNSYLNAYLGNPTTGLSVASYQLGNTFFSPNREVSSPVMFGSLPTGVAHQLPWQTLLFRPGPFAAGLSPAHPGEQGYAVDGSAVASAPPDYLLLDLFWMPVCEPYAISEPFATAGKVNLNYQIEPFTYITRKTALCAVLDSEKIAAVSTSQAGSYKTSGITTTVRTPIDLANTLAQCDSLFNHLGGMIYESPSQICSLFLVPQNPASPYSASTFGTAWYQTGATAPFGLVGDNVRERPYAHIYSRLTTKSNTYSVYYTVQALNNKAATDQTSWNNGTGVVAGEYRGSTVLERYINPNDTLLNSVDFTASSSSTLTLDSYYKWRVVRNDQFSP